MNKRYFLSFLPIVLMISCSPLKRGTSSKTEFVVKKSTPRNVVLYPERFEGEPVDPLDPAPNIVEKRGDDRLDKPVVAVEPELTNVDVDRAYPSVVFTPAQSANVKYSDKTLPKLGMKLDLDALANEFTFPYNSRVISEYGMRGRRIHAGIDVKAISCDTIRAVFDGVVRLSKAYSSYGNTVVIRHYNGLETLYAHNRKILVKVNDVVKSGDPISLEGSTGRSTTRHLHFEVRVDGEYFNPRKLIDFENKKLQSGSLTITKPGAGPLVAALSSVDIKENMPSNLPTFNDSKPTPDTKAGGKKYHKIVPGDTLSKIALKNKTTVSALCKLNNISRDTVIKTGKSLRVS